MTQFFVTSVLSFLLGTSASQASPIEQEIVVCQGLDGDVLFEIFLANSRANAHDSPHALAMRVSDPTVTPALSEIAYFTSQNRQLMSEVIGTTSTVIRVVGLVDLKNPLTGRKGERVGGTVLGSLHSITVDLEMNLNHASAAGKHHAGLVTYLKKNGQNFTQDLDCRLEK